MNRQQADEAFMREAIAAAHKNPQAPFGAVLVDMRDERVVATGWNHISDGPIWHGEMDVIQQASRRLSDGDWEHLCLYTTAEPCCMCQGAIVWAGIRRVVYGTSIATLKQFGWKQFELDAAEVTRRAPWAACQIDGGVLEAECDRLFAQDKGS